MTMMASATATVAKRKRDSVSAGLPFRPAEAEDESRPAQRPRQGEANEAADKAADGQPNQPPAKKKLWDRALDGMSIAEQAALRSCCADDLLRGRAQLTGDEVLQQLRDAALAKQLYVEKKAWKMEVNGRQVILRDVAGKILVWLNKFKEVGDVATQFDPVHAALPWAAVRFALQVATPHSHYGMRS